jgi:hypothetical protein
MSQIRLYLDEDAIDQQLIRAFRSRNIDVTTVGEVQTYGFSDAEQLTFATAQQRVLFTFNVGDYCRLHGLCLAQSIDHAGIIVSNQQFYSVGAQLRGVLRLMAEKSAGDLRNQLVYLSNYLVTD